MPPRGREAGTPEPVSTPRIVRFGSYTLDLSAGELHKNGTRIRVPEQPFQILRLLLQHPGEVVTREELRQRLWAGDTFVDFETGLNSAVKKLRDVLGDSADHPRYIETIPRRGYRFIASVETPVSAQALSTRVDWWRQPWLVLGLGLVAVLAAAFALNIGGLRTRIVVASAGPIDSIAVLPAMNYTGSGDLDYLADGMTDALTTRLAQAKSLTVPSVTSVMYFKRQSKRLPEIARELKVQAVVELSVQRAGQRLQINVQLIHGPTDRHLWAHAYECDPGNVQVVLPSITRDLVEVLKVPATPEEKSRIFGTQQTTPEAYELFSKGRYLVGKGTEEDRRKAAEDFAKVIELDPNYAPAYGQLALLNSHGGAYLVGPNTRAGVLARQWAEKALDLDETLAEAHTALAWQNQSDWNWRDAEKEFKRAIELNPSFPTAHAWYAQFLANRRRFDESLMHAKIAMQLNPVGPATLTHAAVPYMEAGRTDEAIAAWKRVLDFEPNYWAAWNFLGRAYVKKKMYKEAVEAFEKSVALRGRDSMNLGTLAHGYARVGRRAEALKLIAEIETWQKKTGGLNAFALAVAYAGLGDDKKIFAMLETAYAQRRPYFAALNTEPLFEPYQSDPRFHDLMLRMGMPPESLAPAAGASMEESNEQKKSAEGKR